MTAAEKFRKVPSEQAGYTPGRFVVQHYDRDAKVWFDVGDPLDEATADARLAACREGTKTLTVTTWSHNRKGILRGVEVGAEAGTDSEWMHVILVGDHDPNRLYMGQMYRAAGAAFDAEQITVRRSFMTFVSTEDVEVTPDVAAVFATTPGGGS